MTRTGPAAAALLALRLTGLTVLTGLGVLPGVPAFAQTETGEQIFARACASCHVNPAPETRAPDVETLRRFATEAILTSLMTGRMFRQGSELTDAQRIAVSDYSAGRPVGAAPAPSNVGR